MEKRPPRVSRKPLGWARNAASRLRRFAAARERLGIALALGAIGILICAFAAIHVVLAGPLLRGWVNTSPQELLLSYDSASSWVPGVIHVHGLTMRGSDANVQWTFRMEDATISISLFDLLRRRFHATRVRARGLVFRLREKVESNDLSPAHLARLPEIPGFADPPLKSTPPRPPPSPSFARQHFWSVLVENLVADPTSDIWIEIYRFRGQARLTGSFFLHPHAETWIGPALVQFLSGQMELAPDGPLLSEASGRADCVIEPYDPERVAGPEVWRKISGGIAIAGRLEDLRFLNYFLRHSPEPRLQGGGGKFHSAFQFVHGIGRGRAEFDVARVRTAYDKGTLSGRARGRLEVPRWDVARDDMEISGTRVDLSDIVTEGTRKDERDWWGRFQIVSGRLHNGLTAATAVQCRDARPLYTLFGAGLPGWAQGILKLEGLKASANVRLASGRLDVHDLAASGGSFQIAGQYDQQGSRRRGSFLVETGPLAVGVAIDGPSSHVKLLGARKWFRERSSVASPSRAAAE